jgi:propanol-preferring alcohol dehydrogenase
MPADTMRAMVLEQAGEPLKAVDLPIPEPRRDQILLKVLACGVCRTAFHVYDGELDCPKLSLVLEHEIVGRVEELGAHVAVERMRPKGI